MSDATSAGSLRLGPQATRTTAYVKFFRSSVRSSGIKAIWLLTQYFPATGHAKKKILKTCENLRKLVKTSSVETLILKS
jgi:hypothetical protein